MDTVYDERSLFGLHAQCTQPMGARILRTLSLSLSSIAPKLTYHWMRTVGKVLSKDKFNDCLLLLVLIHSVKFSGGNAIFKFNF